MLLTLNAIILFTTFGQAFNSRCKNEDIFQYDSRGKQRAKEMLHSDQGNFNTNPSKSETNNSSTFEQLSVPIPHDDPASYEHLSVPIDSSANFKFLALSHPNECNEYRYWTQDSL
jgi:hypothetical protein